MPLPMFYLSYFQPFWYCVMPPMTSAIACCHTQFHDIISPCHHETTMPPHPRSSAQRAVLPMPLFHRAVILTKSVTLAAALHALWLLGQNLKTVMTFYWNVRLSWY